MIIEIGDNGLRSRYWWTSYDIDDDALAYFCACGGNPNLYDTASVAAYLAVRSLCPFLTDENHDWEARDYGPCKPENQRLKEITQSSRYSIIIKRKPGNERPELYPNRYWFHFAYRVLGQPH